jgi:hypothetical protein
MDVASCTLIDDYAMSALTEAIWGKTRTRSLNARLSQDDPSRHWPDRNPAPQQSPAVPRCVSFRKHGGTGQ